MIKVLTFIAGALLLIESGLATARALFSRTDNVLYLCSIAFCICVGFVLLSVSYKLHMRDMILASYKAHYLGHIISVEDCADRLDVTVEYNINDDTVVLSVPKECSSCIEIDKYVVFTREEGCMPMFDSDNTEKFQDFIYYREEG